MRKLFLALLILVLFAGGFMLVTLRNVFGHDDDDLSVQVKENENKYRFYAYYSRHKTKRIQRYLDHELTSDKNVFRNARIDADMTVDNNILVHVTCKPGLLVIDLDKTKNDSAAYYKIKEVGEELRRKLGED